METLRKEVVETKDNEEFAAVVNRALVRLSDGHTHIANSFILNPMGISEIPIPFVQGKNAAELEPSPDDILKQTDPVIDHCLFLIQTALGN